MRERSGTGRKCGNAWTNMAAGFLNVVNAGAYDAARDALYVGGAFSYHASNSTLVKDLRDGKKPSNWTQARVDDFLAAGGLYNENVRYIARWTGATWTNLGGGHGGGRQRLRSCAGGQCPGE